MNTRNFVRLGLVNVLLVGLVLALAGCPGGAPNKPNPGTQSASPSPSASATPNNGLNGTIQE